MPLMLRAAFRAVRGFEPRLLASDLLSVHGLLREGVGVGLLPRFVAEPSLVAGELVQVLPNERLLEAVGLSLVYPSSGQVPRKVAAFRDYLLEQVRPRWLD